MGVYVFFGLPPFYGSYIIMRLFSLHVHAGVRYFHCESLFSPSSFYLC